MGINERFITTLKNEIYDSITAVSKIFQIFLEKVMFILVRRSLCYKKKGKDTVPWTYVIEGLNCKEIIGTLYEKESQKTLLTVYYWKSNKEKKR